MPASVPYWQRVNPSGNNCSVTKACVSDLFWMFASNVNRARKFRIHIEFSPLKWRYLRRISILLIKSFILPVSLKVRSWVVFFNLYRRYNRTYLCTLFYGLMFFRLGCFDPRFLNLLLTISAYLLTLFFLSCLLRRWREPSSSKLELSNSCSVPGSLRSCSLQENLSLLCCVSRNALFFSVFCKRSLLLGNCTFPGTAAICAFTLPSRSTTCEA